MIEQQPTDPLLEFAERNLRKDADALDIGANQGLYTIPFAAHARNVVAFEPNPELAQLLRTKGEALENVTIVEAAVSDWRGTTTFYVDTRPGVGAAASSLNLLSDLAASNSVRPILVSVTTVDAYVRSAGLSPSFVKIDVEGHEPAVVRGMAHTISTFRPVLVFEFWESWWNRGYRELFDYLSPMYRMTRLATGDDAYAFYTATGGNDVVDITCIPR
jgi:FkbM family methyltransferase